MNKVIVEITPYENTTRVFINGKEFYSKDRITETGARQVEGVDFGEILEIPDNLFDALNSFFAYDVMEALNDIERLK